MLSIILHEKDVVCAIHGLCKPRQRFYIFRSQNDIYMLRYVVLYFGTLDRREPPHHRAEKREVHMTIRKVHVVFKTHLDIGFTDLSKSVIAHYLEKYIPAAMECASAVNRPGRPPMFIWTVGSYLIDLALRTYPKEKWDQLDTAIRNGYITYHALPFTTHSELCDAALFNAGLGIAKRLDIMFGRKTIAAKMSDVPGHTIGIVAPMADSGIEYLHIGINNVALKPQVPPLFVWQNGVGQSLIINYCRSYVGITEVEGHDEALYFMHSQYNMGPPSMEHLAHEFTMLHKKYPGAEIFASNLDAYATGLTLIREKLPVITEEIGDTWIHGTGTDPKKVSALRSLMRLDNAWEQDGTWDKNNSLLDDGRDMHSAYLTELLLVCEHTWGLDFKKYLADFKNWNRSAFDHARKSDRLTDDYGLVPGCEDYFAFAKAEFDHLHPSSVTWATRTYSFYESSHEEQRQYLTRAVSLLPEPLKEKARKIIANPESETQYAPIKTDLALLQGPVQKARMNDISVSYQPDRSVSLSPDGCTELQLAIGAVEYQEVGQSTYENLAKHFLCNVDDNKGWAIPDYCKPGLEFSDTPINSITHRPNADAAMHVNNGALCWKGTYPPSPIALSGCPAICESSLRPLEDGKLLLTVWLRDKPANRKPEALFLPFTFPPSAKVQLQKIGTQVSSEHVVKGGNERCHAVQHIRLIMPEGDGWLLTPLDTPIITIGQPDLLDFSRPDRWDRLYLALYNNLWGTNFKMWYEENILCRVIITYERRTAL